MLFGTELEYWVSLGCLFSAPFYFNLFVKQIMLKIEKSKTTRNSLGIPSNVAVPSGNINISNLIPPRIIINHYAGFFTGFHATKAFREKKNKFSLQIQKKNESSKKIIFSLKYYSADFTSFYLFVYIFTLSDHPRFLCNTKYKKINKTNSNYICVIDGKALISFSSSFLSNRSDLIQVTSLSSSSALLLLPSRKQSNLTFIQITQFLSNRVVNNWDRLLADLVSMLFIS
ncbi:hypothetical protein BpHYR1_027405 [Brachionus plicatilis]|uniref:Uncharacterized protein n=1 Tax=Brachionus plicatilis TaxID=10195 RepID=A0A3M7RRZ6_BRAPC|nr:hypothetical protein BpHYR1_027405 [Brachionus plicatilis]